MGRGGGGGSSHHSSHHSSSHSHSGSSGRSSYRSSGSSYRSSGSSYRSSSSSYRSGSSYSHHSRRSYGSGGGGGGGGFLRGCGGILLFPLLVFIGFAYAFVEDSDLGTFFDVQRSTIQREALPESKCDPIDEWYRDDWGDWIDEDGEAASLENGLKNFYEKTGVQPYLWIMGEEGKDYMSEGSIEELGEATYKDMFGDDEGHVLVIFREYPNDSSNYICTVTPGYDAYTQIMDDEASEILLDYIDYFYTDGELNEGQFFGRAFSEAGERIMTKQLTWNQILLIISVAVVAVIGIIVTASIIKKRKIAVAKQKVLQAQQEAKEAQAVAAQKKTDLDRKKYEDNLETQFVAVTCPNCGSTGNKIRKATVGHCPFCGSAIKVDQEGNVKISRSDEPST
ncbi:MAG: hypothetical protein IKG03_04860 [Clostridiales bacterium]|nr:hypothetical protein [Clostridiales bacterium]